MFSSGASRRSDKRENLHSSLGFILATGHRPGLFWVTEIIVLEWKSPSMARLSDVHLVQGVEFFGGCFSAMIGGCLKTRKKKTRNRRLRV
jgi:hypothetical protein